MLRKEYFSFALVFAILIALTGNVRAVSSSSSSTSGQFSEAKVGQSAPQFDLLDTKGKTIKLSDNKGKYVVLEWFNQSCPFVKKHYESGNMQKLQKEYTGKGVIWLSICSSAPGKPGNCTAAEYNEMFAAKNAAPSAILTDTNGVVGHLYGAKTTPAMYVIDPKGILIYAGAIDDIPGVDITEISQAQNYVKAALDESMSGKPVKVSQTKSYGCSVKY